MKVNSIFLYPRPKSADALYSMNSYQFLLKNGEIPNYFYQDSEKQYIICVREEMIHSIRLKNFESHKNSVFEFSPYINIISGQSNHGKSSVIRSIYWIKDNKPSGSSMVSFWNRDKKGNPKQRTFAEIVAGEDEVAIRRERSPDLNGYEINDSSRLEAVGCEEARLWKGT